MNYSLQKTKEKQKVNIILGDKAAIKINFKKTKISINNENLSNKIILNKTKKYINKLFNLYIQLMESGDGESRDLIDEVLKFRRIFENKYKAYLRTDEIDAILKKIGSLELELKKLEKPGKVL